MIMALYLGVGKGGSVLWHGMAHPTTNQRENLHLQLQQPEAEADAERKWQRARKGEEESGS